MTTEISWFGTKLCLLGALKLYVPRKYSPPRKKLWVFATWHWVHSLSMIFCSMVPWNLVNFGIGVKCHQIPAKISKQLCQKSTTVTLVHQQWTLVKIGKHFFDYLWWYQRKHFSTFFSNIHKTDILRLYLNEKKSWKSFLSTGEILRKKRLYTFYRRYTFCAARPSLAKNFRKNSKYLKITSLEPPLKLANSF